MPIVGVFPVGSCVVIVRDQLGERCRTPVIRA